MKSKRQKALEVFVHKENGQQYQSEGFMWILQKTENQNRIPNEQKAATREKDILLVIPARRAKQFLRQTKTTNQLQREK